MTEVRRRFHEELAALETELLEVGGMAELAVARAVEALVSRDPALAQRVVDEDDLIDDRYGDIERRVFDAIALQTPVATDLRLVSVIMHVNMHLERVGDQAVNIAKLTLVSLDQPRDDTIIGHLQEMADVVQRMLRTALDAFARRDIDLARSLPAMDDPVDVLNRGMYRQVVQLAGDPGALEWGIRMNTVARQLERVGDHAVDIGEQVGFLLTGAFRSFSEGTA